MSVQERYLQKADTIELSSIARAQGIAERLQKFANGQELTFQAYFMLDYEPHEKIKTHFLKIIGVETEQRDDTVKILPQNIGGVVLRTMSNEDNGVPFDVTYTGKRLLNLVQITSQTEQV